MYSIFVSHITVNGNEITNYMVDLTKDSERNIYEKEEKWLDRFLKNLDKGYKSILSKESSTDFLQVFVNETIGDAKCVKIKRHRTIVGLHIPQIFGEPERRNVVIGKIYEGVDPHTKKMSHYSINCMPFDDTRTKFYLRDEWYWEKHYDMSATPPTLITPVKDILLDIQNNEEGVQKLIDQYNLKPID